MSARYMWGGKAGCTFTSMRLRWNNNTILTFTASPFNPTVSGIAGSTTDWVPEATHADEFNGPGWMQYLVTSTGVNVHWTLQYVRLEGRYVRA